MPFDASKYPKNWREFSLWIRDVRAEGSCEQCRAPNHRVVVRSNDGASYLLLGEDDALLEYSADDGCFLGETNMLAATDGYRDDGVRIVLTVAHLNSPDDTGRKCFCDPLCANPDHVKAWCQRCHLNYDRARHAENRKRNRPAKLAARELFE